MASVVRQNANPRKSWGETCKRSTNGLLQDSGYDGKVASALAASTISQFYDRSDQYETECPGTKSNFTNWRAFLTEVPTLQDIATDHE
ncbi:uncharacterized protein L199_000076 [Kwoniella botswanensis]|uniref:uncharacterized protein n=1 Tax=Kwoniella botswanensis TaxID=1268659 RepID=UPI00315DDE9B